MTYLDTDFRKKLENASQSVRKPLEEASHVPYWIYSDPAVLEVEKELLFKKDWICVGRVEQIEKTGDYMSIDVMGEPIVIVRNDEGKINAFSNFCLHRGAEISKKGIGNTQEFVCPYHSWLYDLNGNLLGAPHMRETRDFNPRECSLPRIRVDTWGGFIFVCFDSETPSLPDFIKVFAEEFSFLRMEDCAVSSVIEFNLDCNWKFVVENLFDIYHVTVIHKGTFGKFRDTIDYFPFAKGQESLFGYYKAASSVEGGKSLFGNMPWLSDKPADFACSGFQGPNLQMFGRCDSAIVHCIWPISPNKTKMLSYQLFPKEFFSDPEFNQKKGHYRDFIKEIIAEDEEAILSLQRAANSHVFRAGRMSRLEHGVYNVMNYYFDRLLAAADKEIIDRQNRPSVRVGA